MTAIRTPITIVPVTLTYEGGEDFSDLDVADAICISDTLEQVDIGGGLLGTRYLRFSGPDLVAAIDALRRVLDRAQDAVLDARQARIDAERQECPGCRTLIEPDENTCGAAACEREWALDMAGLVP